MPVFYLIVVKIAVFLVVIGTVLIPTSAVFAQPRNENTDLQAALSDHFAHRDFIQYWAAWQLAQRGQNPFDGRSMLTVQRELVPEQERATMLWAPPATILVFAPFLTESFALAAGLYLLFGLSVWLVLSVLGATGFFKHPLTARVSVWCLALAAIFYPVLDSIRSGQLGMILALAVAGIYFGVWRQRPFFTGLCAGIFILKPHLFLLPLVALAFQIFAVRQKRLRFLTAFTLTALILSVVAELRFPGVTVQWLAATGNHQLSEFYVARLEWVSDTVLSQIRYLTLYLFNWRGDSLLIVFPLLGLLIWFGLLAAMRFNGWRLSDQGLLTLSFALGALFAPYGWVSDYAIFLLPALLLQRQLMEQEAVPVRWFLMPAFLLLMFLLPGIFGLAINSQVHILAVIIAALTVKLERNQLTGSN